MSQAMSQSHIIGALAGIGLGYVLLVLIFIIGEWWEGRHQ